MPSRKGAPNRNKTFLNNRLKDMYGDDFDPIMKMAENAFRAQELLKDERGSEFEFDMIIKTNGLWSSIAEYCAPKLKAVEHSGPDGEPLQIGVIDYANHNTE